MRFYLMKASRTLTNRRQRLILARRTIRAEIEEQERKSGERFFGLVPMLPLGRLLVPQIPSISQSAASAALDAITGSITTGAKAVTAIGGAAKMTVKAIIISGIAVSATVGSLTASYEVKVQPSFERWLMIIFLFG